MKNQEVSISGAHCFMWINITAVLVNLKYICSATIPRSLRDFAGFTMALPIAAGNLSYLSLYREVYLLEVIGFNKLLKN